MKVIFLDFDGVINNLDKNNLVNLEYVKILKQIIEQTGAKVVVSSDRRKEFMEKSNVDYEKTFFYNYFEKNLNSMGIEIYDYTPFLNVDKSMKRELEITTYLKEHPEIEEFVILDDLRVLASLEEHQVFIEYSNGLQEEHINPAIAILNGQLGFIHLIMTKVNLLQND